MRKPIDPSLRYLIPYGLDTNLEDRYMNIPINLLNGIFDNKDLACQKIIKFCLYHHARTRLQFGEMEERFELAAEFFGVKINSLLSNLVEGELLYEDWIRRKSPRGGIKIKIFHDIMVNEKSEFEIALFCAHVGLKSILQNDRFKKTSFDALFARMAGYSSAKNAEGRIPAILMKYQSRHYRLKLILALQKYWHLAYEADHTRGFYFSFRLNHEALCMQIQNSRVKRKTFQTELALKKKINREKVRLFCNDQTKPPEPDINSFQAINQNGQLH